MCQPSSMAMILLEMYFAQRDEGRTSCHISRLGTWVYSSAGICFYDALLEERFLAC